MIDNHWSKLMMWVISSFGITSISFWYEKNICWKGWPWSYQKKGVKRHILSRTDTAYHLIAMDGATPILVYLLEVYWSTFLRELRCNLLSTRLTWKMKQSMWEKISKSQPPKKKNHEMSCTPPFPLISSQPDTRIATRKSNCNGWSVLRPVYHAKKVVTLPIITHFGGKGFPQLSNIWRAKGLKLTVCFLKLNCLDQQKNNEQTKRALPNCKVIKHGKCSSTSKSKSQLFSIMFLFSSYHLHTAFSKGGPLAVTCGRHLWYHATQPATRMARTATFRLVTQILQHGLHVSPEKKNVQKFCLDG